MRKVEKRLRERVKTLEKELTEVKEDRQKFRDFTVNNLKTAIRIHGESKYWNMQSLIEALSKNLQSVKYFYW